MFDCALFWKEPIGPSKGLARLIHNKHDLSIYDILYFDKRMHAKEYAKGTFHHVPSNFLHNWLIQPFLNIITNFTICKFLL